MIADYLSGNPLKCYRKHAAELYQRLKDRLSGSDQPDPRRNFVPIRSPQLDGHIKPSHKAHWSFHKPRKPKVSTRPTKQPKTAQDILNDLDL